MTSKDDPIPKDVQEAFQRAAEALFAWSSIGGDEPTIAVHGSPKLISIVATLAESYKDIDACRVILAHGPSCQLLA